MVSGTVDGERGAAADDFIFPGRGGTDEREENCVELLAEYMFFRATSSRVEFCCCFFAPKGRDGVSRVVRALCPA